MALAWPRSPSLARCLLGHRVVVPSADRQSGDDLDYAETIRGNAVFEGVVAALDLDAPLGVLLVHAAARRLEVSLDLLSRADLRAMRDEVEAGLRLVVVDDEVTRALAAYDAYAV